MNGKICIKCRIELRPKTNGVFALEMNTFGAISLAQADLWHCPECGLEVVLGFATEPFARHCQTDFVETVEAARDDGRPVIEFWLNQKERMEYLHGCNNPNPR